MPDIQPSAEFLDRLGLTGVALAESDCGRAQTVAARHPERQARLLLVACDAFDNTRRACPASSSAWPAGCPAVSRSWCAPRA